MRRWQFLVIKNKHIMGLRFSSVGCAVVVVPCDGQAAQLFELLLGPSAGKVMGNIVVEKESKWLLVSVVAKREMWMLRHVYDLKRGRTSAVMEVVEHADDVWWVAFVMRK
jgi:hypothetical protein